MKNGFLFCCLFLFFACQKKEMPPVEIPPSVSQFLFNLPLDINESSGLILHNQSLLTHNDSGDLPKLYQINLDNGTLENSICIDSTLHRDWEGITQNESHIFIGDFGNNRGNRTDLVIYKISKTDFVLLDSFPFSYANQVDFEPDFESHNFNMEAMIATEEYLFLFSKNHLNNQTDLYQIDLQNPTPTDTLNIIQSFDTQGLVTDAAYWKSTKTLALLGYTNVFDFEPFVWIISDFSAPNYFGGAVQKIDLDVAEQTEGMTFLDERTLLISSEKEVASGGKVLRVTY